jgi:glycosyltransferase involved in cell wall biosynthesis
MSSESTKQLRNTIVVLPALNEETSIKRAIDGIRKVMPDIKFLVIDNGSTDSTYQIAIQSGADVVREPQKGKGYAVRRAFNNIPAGYSIVFMVDSDDTYSYDELVDAVKMITKFGFDMVVGNRVPLTGSLETRKQTFKKGHTSGNFLLTKIGKILHKVEIDDALSGWRVMSLPFVKSFPGGASGFEIEAELNAHAYMIDAAVSNIDVKYQGRLVNSNSKLNTYADGVKILRMNFSLFRDNRPQYAFTLFASPWLILSTYLITRALVGYFETGLVNQFPSLFAGIGAFVVASLLWTSGMILQRIKLVRTNLLRFKYAEYAS